MSFRIPSSLHQISQLVSANLITKVLGIGVLMVYVRILTKEQMAVIPVYQMLAGVTMLPFGFGLSPTLLKRLPQLFRDRPDTARSMVYSSSLMIVGGSLFATCIVLFFRHEIAWFVLDDDQYGLVAWMSLGFVPAAIFRIADRVLWTQSRFGQIASLEVVLAVLRPLLTLPLFFVYGITGLVIGLVLAQITRTMIALFFIRDVLAGGVPGIYPLRQLLRESFPFYLEGYLMYFRREGDNWFVSMMLGPANLAVYYIAKTIYSTFYTLYGSIDKVVVERFAKFRKDIWQLSSLVQTTHDAISHVMVPCVLLTISLLPSAVWILGGGRYERAEIPAAILLIAVMISFLRLPMERAIFVGLPSSYRFYTVLLETIFLFLALLALGPLYGVAGIAAARVVGQLSGGVFGLALLSKKMGIRLRFNHTVMSLLISCVVTAPILFLQVPFETLIQGVVCAAVSTVVWLVSFAALSYMINSVAMNQLIQLCRDNSG